MALLRWIPAFLAATVAVIHLSSSQLTVKGCQGCSDMSTFIPGSHSEVVYQPSSAGVINPERGGAYIQGSVASAPGELTVAILDNLRQTLNIDLVWRQWYLDTFLTSAISSSFLGHIEADMNTLRAAGFKATIRFIYTVDPKLAIKDPTPTQMLAHIAQLKPYLHAHEDVIASVQIGLIGVWGEWYFSTYFGNKGVLTPSDIQNRKAIVAALLDAVPSSRSLHIRTPTYKRYITGLATALTAADYRDGSKSASRIGHHNDCFLASSTDYGTYKNLTVDYQYLAEDTKYVPMGGETCHVNPPRSQCTTAKTELKQFHWTFLNLAYNVNVLNGWKKEGCFDEVMNNLGYRLRLTKAVLPDRVAPGSNACFLIEFKNEGYASPINPRHVKLILRGSNGNYTSGHIDAFTSAEPWLPEYGTISVKFSLKMDVPAGDYEVLLELSDPLASLSNNPDYSIILLNAGVPEIKTGLNNLRHIIKVTGTETSGFTNKQTTATSNRKRCYSGCTELEMKSLPDITSKCKNNLIKNGGMETTASFLPGSQVHLTTIKRFNGKSSFRVQCGRQQGFYQNIRFSNSDGVKHLTAILWSYASNIPSYFDNPSDYSLYVDLTLADNSNVWGLRKPFNPSTNGWQKRVVDISTEKNIISAKVWALCRVVGESAVAHFDEMGLFVPPASCAT